MSTQYVHPQFSGGLSQPVVVQGMSGLGFQGRDNSGGTCIRIVEKFRAKPVLIMGIMILIIGIACIAVNIAEISEQSEFGVGGHGIYCGIVFIVSGAFAIVAANRRTLCFIINCMVLSIISATMALPVIGFSIGGLFAEKTNWNFYVYATPDPSCCSYGYDDYGESLQNNTCCDVYEEGYYDSRTLALREFLHGLILGVMEAIVAICVSSLCCHAVCCCSNESRPARNTVTYQPANQGMQYILIQGQNGVQAIPLNLQNVVHNPQPGPAVQGFSPADNNQQPSPPPAYSNQPDQQFEIERPPPYQVQFALNGEQDVKSV